MNRRQFLGQAASCATAVWPLTALLERGGRAASLSHRGQLTSGYGPLREVADGTTGLPLLRLPDGFTYVSFGWTGDRLASGAPTPPLHDGMGAFAAGPGRVRLVRNHEVGRGVPFSAILYDREAAGGTTTLEFDCATGAPVGAAHDSLSGTMRNCAGGVTPWGSWLTCEETTDFGRAPHGYIFEVPADGRATAEPLRDMGRFSHEAVAVDPATGFVYETEDAGRRSGFYRFVPRERGRLAEGGRLSMLRVKGTREANLGASYAAGTTFDVEWVSLATPDNPRPTTPSDAVWAQGRAQGAATFARLEGCWHGDGRIYVVSTSGGRGHGQVWEYAPQAETIRLLFESPSPQVLNMPDNITVSPRGGLVLCEDGGAQDCLRGLTTDGQLFTFAENTVVLNGERNGLIGDFRGSEWAGVCYSPDGRWLFVNVQIPGITFAITGPWDRGAL